MVIQCHLEQKKTHLFTVDNPNHALLVVHSHVARPQPPVGVERLLGRLFVAPIAQHDVWSPQEQLARLAHGDLFAVVVEKLGLAVGQQHAAARLAVHVAARQARRRARQLRHAPALREVEAVPVGDVVLQVGLERRRAAVDVLDAREVVLFDLGPLGQHDDNGRHHLQNVGPVALDALQVALEIEDGHDVDGNVAAGGHEDRVHLPVGVVEREKGEPDVVLQVRRQAVRVPRAENLLHIGNEVAVGAAHALGQARGAGAVVDGGQLRARLGGRQRRPRPRGGDGLGREKGGPVAQALDGGGDGIAGDVVAKVKDAVAGELGLGGGGEDVVNLGGVGEDDFGLGVGDLVGDFCASGQSMYTTPENLRICSI